MTISMRRPCTRWTTGLRYLPELVDEVREMIAEELEQEGTSPQEYLRFHCNAIKDEHLQKVFGVTDKSQLTNAVFLKALKLGHVGIFPGQPERYFVLDFTLGCALHRRGAGGVRRRGRRRGRRNRLGVLNVSTLAQRQQIKRRRRAVTQGDRPPSCVSSSICGYILILRLPAARRGPSWWPRRGCAGTLRSRRSRGSSGRSPG